MAGAQLQKCATGAKRVVLKNDNLYFRTCSVLPCNAGQMTPNPSLKR